MSSLDLNSKAGKATPANVGASAAFPFILQFPNPLNPREIQVQVHPGLTIRDYFAAKAMAGLLEHVSNGNHGLLFTDIAERSYVLADIMVEARLLRVSPDGLKKDSDFIPE